MFLQTKFHSPSSNTSLLIVLKLGTNLKYSDDRHVVALESIQKLPQLNLNGFRTYINLLYIISGLHINGTSVTSIMLSLPTPKTEVARAF
jgi:hypothetical protein